MGELEFLEKDKEKRYSEIFRLKDMLTKANISFYFTWKWPSYHLIVKDDEEEIISVIEGEYTYGGKENLLEIMGLLTPAEKQSDTVKGYLTAEEVFERISNYFQEKNIAKLVNSIKEAMDHFCERLELACKNISENIMDNKSEKVAPKLTEDERVILRNMPQKEWNYIFRDNMGNIQFEHLKANGAPNSIGRANWYNHLFQFIKERRRI